MFHEVATLVHPIESSKPEVRAEGIRLDVPLEVPRLLEGQPCLASVATDNLSRDRVVHDKKIAGDRAVHKKIAGDFVLIWPCR